MKAPDEGWGLKRQSNLNEWKAVPRDSEESSPEDRPGKKDKVLEVMTRIVGGWRQEFTKDGGDQWERQAVAWFCSRQSVAHWATYRLLKPYVSLGDGAVVKVHEPGRWLPIRPQVPAFGDWVLCLTLTRFPPTDLWRHTLDLPLQVHRLVFNGMDHADLTSEHRLHNNKAGTINMQRRKGNTRGWLGREWVGIGSMAWSLSPASTGTQVQFPEPSWSPRHGNVGLLSQC